MKYIAELEWNKQMVPPYLGEVEQVDWDLTLVETLVNASNLAYRHTMTKPGTSIRAGAVAFERVKQLSGFVEDANGMVLRNRWIVALDPGLQDEVLVMESEPYPHFTRIEPATPDGIPEVHITAERGIGGVPRPKMMPGCWVLVRIVDKAS